ncbi:MAG: twin-arginine translocation signal domain-containing protein, partial [Gammaproteobacteria bacterium]|nr:twin-arginine translocation signal domain-containing protein [Gammaproteobacteria bacterium]
MQRRNFLKSGLAGGTVAVAVGAGLLSPRGVLGAWPSAAFDAK